jgi:ectoine hydroxylase-related dioxygenase (phytanoyl-CoA dioxygenase family)
MHEQLGSYLWKVVGRELVAVKATLFDKTAESNWRAQWHQDRTIAVRQRMDVAGYGPWSTKAGVVHVEPPESVLAQMLAVRIHLDACGADNGPLRVIPGSHEQGKISDDQLKKSVGAAAPFDLVVPKGTIVLMRPLLLHASTPARQVDHRRVLHIEFGPAEAISPLKWETAVALRRAA